MGRIQLARLAQHMGHDLPVGGVAFARGFAGRQTAGKLGLFQAGQGRVVGRQAAIDDPVIQEFADGSFCVNFHHPFLSRVGAKHLPVKVNFSQDFVRQMLRPYNCCQVCDNMHLIIIYAGGWF